MSFVISATKSSVDSNPDFHKGILTFCEGVIENGDFMIYVPLAGRTISVLKLFAANGVKFRLIKEPFDIRNSYSLRNVSTGFVNAAFTD